MDKQSNNIAQIKYKVGDFIRDRYGEIAKIVKVNGTKSSINYLSTEYDSEVSMGYILGNYVPCVFQEGDLVIFKNDIVKITGLIHSSSDNKYFYIVQSRGVPYFELVKDIDTYGEYTKD